MGNGLDEAVGRRLSPKLGGKSAVLAFIRADRRRRGVHFTGWLSTPSLPVKKRQTRKKAIWSNRQLCSLKVASGITKTFRHGDDGVTDTIDISVATSCICAKR